MKRTLSIEMANKYLPAGSIAFEKRGCNFYGEDKNNGSDVGNYRITTLGESVTGKDGNNYFLEFCLWRDRKKARTTHKKTGKQLKHVHYDVINPIGLTIDTEYTNDNGNWRNIKLESSIYDLNLSYTLGDILKAINIISEKQYTRICFIDSLALEVIPDILKIAGYREKDVIEHLTGAELIQNDKNYLVYRYTTDGGNYFEYELKSGRITA